MSIKGKKIYDQLNLDQPSLNIINNYNEYPNDSINIDPLIKCIRRLSPNPIKNIISPHSIYYSPLKIRGSVISSSVSKPNIDVKRLTINNNTNISNYNIYYYNFNLDRIKSEENYLKPNNNKEPEDNVKKKKNYKKKISIIKEEEENAPRKNKFSRDYLINHVIKEVHSKSPMNNTKKRNKMTKNETLPRLGDKIKTNPGVFKIEPNGKLKLSEYSVINQIGKGTFGKIYAVKWKKNDKKYALKKELLYNLELVEKRNSIVEIIHDFLEKTNNKGVMNIYSNLWEKNKTEYNYYELMEIGERDWEKEIIARSKSSSYYTEEELFNIASQLIKTLALLQKNRITHRDIKPQNILIVDGQYKLCDFGEIRIMKREEGIVVQRIRGSELYMSPILFFGLRNGLIQVKHNTYKSDVYSLGMCLLYASSMHFSGTDEIREMTDMDQIKETLCKYLGDRYSNKIISLIHSMLETEELLRPDFISLEKKLDSYK